jgi:hypothetical protein
MIAPRGPRAGVEGLDDVLRNLKRFGAGTERAVSQSVVASGLAIQGQARRDVAWDTGRLRNSIAVAEDEETLALVSDIAAPGIEAPNAIRPGMLSAVVGTNVQYAKRIEFGFIGVDSMGRYYNQAPRPYLFPALEQERKPFFQRLRRSVDRAMRGASE